MITLSNLLGQDAIALGTATKTGTVNGISLDGNRIVAVGLSDRAIHASAVRSFEGDVLTYDEQDEPVDDGLTPGDPRGSMVLDMHGDGLGTIVDLGISADGMVEDILLSDGNHLPGARLRAVGSFAAVLNVDLPPPTGLPVA